MQINVQPQKYTQQYTCVYQLNVAATYRTGRKQRGGLPKTHVSHS